MVGPYQRLLDGRMSVEETGTAGAREAGERPDSPAVGWLLGRAPWALWAVAAVLMGAVIFNIHRHSPTVGDRKSVV